MSVLNYVDTIRIGGNTPSAVYLGSTKVWPGWKPTDISGCAIWMDPTTVVVSNGNITSWPNKGSGGNPTVGGTPYLTTLNNRPVVRMSQGQGKFRWYSGTGVDKDWTLVYIGRRWYTAYPGRIVSALISVSNILVGYWNAYFDQAYIEGWLTSAASPSATTAWRMYSADSSSSSVARLFTNGMMIAFGQTTPAKGWGGTLCINGHSDGTNYATTEECYCDVAELIMYNRKLSDTERQTVENYLRTKWDTPQLPFTPFDVGFDVKGWFDASDPNSLQVIGSGVNTWNTKSNQGSMQFLQNADANRPPYNAIDKMVAFADDDIMSTGNPPTTGFDFVMVARPRPASVNNWRTLFRNLTSPHLGIVENGSTRWGVYNSGFFPAGSLTWDNVWGIGYGRFGDNAIAYLSRDGGALTTTGTTIATGNALPSYFGGYQGPPVSQGFGDIRELIVLTYNLQDSTRQQLEGFLAWKWGMTNLLVSGHPYKNVQP